MPVQDRGTDVDRTGNLIDRDAMKSFTSKKALSSGENGLSALRA